MFDDGEEGSRVPKWSEDGTETSGAFLSLLLKYMETPQYLRQTLFPRHPSLQFAVYITTFSHVNLMFMHLNVERMSHCRTWMKLIISKDHVFSDAQLSFAMS